MLLVPRIQHAEADGHADAAEECADGQHEDHLVGNFSEQFFLGDFNDSLGL